ncbi:MAG: hypothetical protein HKL80_02285 [Acidimicrobiales bacterium]|nr:hypothetical protein [Acidimicrobiales bacterium]
MSLFWILTAVITLASLAWRIFYVIHWNWNQPLQGDAFYFHWQPWMIAHGLGFSDPYVYFGMQHGVNIPSSFYTSSTHQLVPSAHHPPLLCIILAAGDLLTLQSFGTQLLILCFFGAATVTLCSILGRMLGGERVGVLAALIATIYPGMWIYDGQLLAEQLAQFTVALLLIQLVLFWRNRSMKNAILTGVFVALAALTRAELLMFILAPFLLAVFSMKQDSIKKKVRVVGIATAATVLVLSPWVIRNLVVFQYPEIIATDLGATVEAANCAASYDGTAQGYEVWNCVGLSIQWHDESYYDHVHLVAGLNYIDAHKGQAAIMAAARVGRLLYLFKPHQQATFILNFIDGWPQFADTALWYSSYPVEILGIVGLIILKKKRIPISPYILTFVIVLTATIIAFGDIRFRAVGEVPLTVLAAVALDWFIKAGVGKFKRIATPGSKPSEIEEITEEDAAIV